MQQQDGTASRAESVLLATAHPTAPLPVCSFNKREEDFDSKQEFDDYLEAREDVSECWGETGKDVLAASRPRCSHPADYLPCCSPTVQSSTWWRALT